MPLFDYVCDGCGHAFEALVSPERKPACPACDGVRLTKELSRFAVAAATTTGSQPACGTCGDPRGAGACQLG